jgi:transcriptional regulator with XRE-family HTH domain
MVLRDRRKLQRLMTADGISHRALARAAGYRSHNMVGELLSGQRRNVSDAAAAGMAELLGVSVDVLFDRVERPCA